MSFSASVADSRLIDNAQSGLTPVSPSRKKIYMMAFLLGMGIPVGFISVKELLNQKIRTSADIEAARAEAATDLEIHDTVLIAAAFCMYNRYVDGLATIPAPGREAYDAVAELIVEHGYGAAASAQTRA